MGETSEIPMPQQETEQKTANATEASKGWLSRKAAEAAAGAGAIGTLWAQNNADANVGFSALMAGGVLAVGHEIMRRRSEKKAEEAK